MKLGFWTGNRRVSKQRKRPDVESIDRFLNFSFIQSGTLETVQFFNQGTREKAAKMLRQLADKIEGHLDFEP